LAGGGRFARYGRAERLFRRAGDRRMLAGRRAMREDEDDLVVSRAGESLIFWTRADAE
jgi:hypothetical protein